MTGHKPLSNLPTSCDCSSVAGHAGRPTSAPRFAAFWRVTAVALCLGLMAAAGGEFKMPKPPMPVVKTKVRALHSPRGAETYLATPMAIVLPPRLFALAWTYPISLPQANIEFVVESRPDLKSTWRVLGITNKPPFPITTTAPRMMYRVGSRWKQ